MSKVITRFAPSPTGYLHIGNARTALINWLYAKKNNGEFILRIDDTDLERSNKEYEDAISQDLKWLGIDWDKSFRQSARLNKYNIAKEKLIQDGRLYPCFETSYELEFKRKVQLSNGKPPIYDRAALKLTPGQIEDLISKGKKPHYRFLIKDEDIYWHDMIKGDMRYKGHDLSDPVVVREDGSFTYMLCSCVDDIEYNITHIIRGEDHVTNTAIQFQMFDAFSSDIPIFGHLSLVKTKDDKISKRVGGFEIKELKPYIEPMTIANFFTFIGSSKPMYAFTKYKELINEFDITSFSKSPTTYMEAELLRLNHKLLIHYSFDEIKDRIAELGVDDKIDEKFWLAVRPNLYNLADLSVWKEICFEHRIIQDKRIDPYFISLAIDTLPNEKIDADTLGKWTKDLAKVTGKSGKELFLPLRLALIGGESGPELKRILPLIGYEEIIKRLKSYL